MSSAKRTCAGRTMDRRGAARAQAFALAAMLMLAGGAFAQDEGEEDLDEIVVTATRTGATVGRAAGSVTVITAREIAESGKTAVSDVLRGVPALDVIQSGGPGHAVDVLLRGAEPRHTLVLIDGIEVNDPMWFGRVYDLGDLGTENIEQIEILRGPQSLLYGSDALGGVVNIVTRTGRGKPGASLGLDGGSYGMIRATADAGGRSGAASWSACLSRSRADGVSAAGEAYGNTEPDGFENTSLSGKLTLEPRENAAFDFTMRYVDAAADIDDFAGAGGDDPNHTQVSQQLVVGAAARLGGGEDRWAQRIGLSIVTHHREDNDDPDAIDPTVIRDTFDSETLKLDWQNNVKLSGASSLTFGVEAEREGGRSGGSSSLDEAADMAGLYVQDETRFGEGSSVAFGARVDDHSMFGAEATWRAAAAHLVAQSGTKLKATVGTGFKAPTLYQLYSSYGDPGLAPEESLGWDVGVERRLAGGAASVGVTYFRNDFENLIDWDGLKYSNIGEARTQGAEVVAALKPRAGLELSTSYTYTEAVDETTGAPLIRRPDHKVGLRAGWRPSDRATLDLRVTYVGERGDNEPGSWPAVPITLEPYALVGVSASFDATEKLRVFARIENLLDADYEEAAGYGAPGISAYFGVKAQF